MQKRQIFLKSKKFLLSNKLNYGQNKSSVNSFSKFESGVMYNFLMEMADSNTCLVVDCLYNVSSAACPPDPLAPVSIRIKYRVLTYVVLSCSGKFARSPPDDLSLYLSLFILPMK